MRKSWLVGGGVLALAAAALFLLPSVSLAQRRFFGGGGGYPGYGWGGYGYGYGRGYPGYYGYGWGSPYNSGYYGYNRGWYSPNVYNYGPSYSFDSGSYPLPAGPTYYGGEYATDQGTLPQQGSMPADMSTQDPNAAHILVRVPGNAKVFFENQPTNQQGSVRAFVSPPLDPNKDYTYDVKAQWTTPDGKQQEATRHIQVHAGRSVQVNFMQPQGRQPAYGAESGTESEDLLPPADRNLHERRGETGQPGAAPAPLPQNEQPRTTTPAPSNRDQNQPAPKTNQNQPGTNPPAGSNQNRNPSNP